MRGLVCCAVLLSAVPAFGQTAEQEALWTLTAQEFADAGESIAEAKAKRRQYGDSLLPMLDAAAACLDPVWKRTGDIVADRAVEAAINGGAVLSGAEANRVHTASKYAIASYHWGVGSYSSAVPLLEYVRDKSIEDNADAVSARGYYEDAVEAVESAIRFYEAGAMP